MSSRINFFDSQSRARRRTVMMTSYKRARVAKEEETDPETDGEEHCITSVENAVYFYATVDKRNVLKLYEKLHEATVYEKKRKKHGDPSEQRIYLYIHSPGGCLFSGFSAMNHIWWNEVPVVTVVDGFVASAATFLLLGGVERKIFSHSRMLIHQLSTAFWGKYVDLLDEVRNSQDLMKSVKHIYTTYTKMRSECVDDLLSKELYMSTDDAITYGFVDEVW